MITMRSLFLQILGVLKALARVALVLMYTVIAFEVAVTEAVLPFVKRVLTVIADVFDLPRLLNYDETSATKNDDGAWNHSNPIVPAEVEAESTPPPDIISSSPHLPITYPTITQPTITYPHLPPYSIPPFYPWYDPNLSRHPPPSAVSAPRYSGATQTEHSLHPRVEELTDNSTVVGQSNINRAQGVSRASGPPAFRSVVSDAKAPPAPLAFSAFARPANATAAQSPGSRSSSASTSSSAPPRSTPTTPAVSVPSARILPSPRRRSPRRLGL